jgi:hypothetical protein
MVQNKSQIEANVVRFWAYTPERTLDRDALSDEAKGFLKGAKDLVAVYLDGHLLFAPSRWVGYVDNSFAAHAKDLSKHGGSTTKQMNGFLGPCGPNVGLDREFVALCAKLGFEPHRKPRKYWPAWHRDQEEGGQAPENGKEASTRKTTASTALKPLLDEIDQQAPEARERLRREVETLVRDARLRPAVLRAWGGRLACAACGLDLSTPDSAGERFESEVAHIMDVAADGPDDVRNAVPLCRTHHWAFDERLWAPKPTSLVIEVVAPLRKHPFLAKIDQCELQVPEGWGATARRYLEWRWRTFKGSEA